MTFPVTKYGGKMKLENYLSSHPAAAESLKQLPPEFVKKSMPVIYEPGQAIIRRDTEVNFAYALIDGKVCSFNETAEGKRSVWVEMNPVSILSDIEILAEKSRYLANVSAVTQVALLRCDIAVFKDLLRKNSSFLWSVTTKLAQKNYAISFAHGHTDFCSNMEKTVFYLLHYCMMNSPAEGGCVCIQKTREMMASEAIVSQRTLERCLRRLKDENCISVLHGRIYISEEQYNKMYSVWNRE